MILDVWSVINKRRCAVAEVWDDSIQTNKPIHKETLTKGKLELLKIAAEHVKETMKNDVPLSIFNGNINHYNNFQKLRYSNLIHYYKKNGQKVRGHWLITRNGWAFLRGETTLPKYVLVQDNHIVGHADRQISVKDVFYGSDVIQTNFEYFDEAGEPVGFYPSIKQNSLANQIGLRL